MGFFFVFAGVVLLGVVLAGFLVFAGGRTIDKSRVRATGDADRLLDERFAGDALVVYESNPATLDVATVVKGADVRGYDLAGQSSVKDAWGASHTLTFKRRD